MNQQQWRNNNPRGSSGLSSRSIQRFLLICLTTVSIGLIVGTNILLSINPYPLSPPHTTTSSSSLPLLQHFTMLRHHQPSSTIIIDPNNNLTNLISTTLTTLQTQHSTIEKNLLLTLNQATQRIANLQDSTQTLSRQLLASQELLNSRIERERNAMEIIRRNGDTLATLHRLAKKRLQDNTALMMEQQEQTEKKKRRRSGMLPWEREHEDFLYGGGKWWMVTPAVVVDGRDGVTFFAWVYPKEEDEDGGGRRRTIVTTRRNNCDNGDAMGYQVYLDNRNGELYLTIEYVEESDDVLAATKQEGRSCVILSSDEIIPTHRWSHIGLTLHPTTTGAKLYLNGYLIATRQHYHGNKRRRIPTSDRSEDATTIGRSNGGDDDDDSEDALNGHVALMGFVLGGEVVWDEKQMEEVAKATERGLIVMLTDYERRKAGDGGGVQAFLYPCDDVSIEDNGDVSTEITESLRRADGRAFHNLLKPSLKSKTHYQPRGGYRYASYRNGSTTTTTTTPHHSPQTLSFRKSSIQSAMKHAWTGYKTYAYGHDELRPLSRTPLDVYGHIGTTLIDSLDTLWLMNMTDEFYEARDWIRDNLDFDRAGTVSVFETTIRCLGGLLAAYDLSDDAVFRDKAIDLGERLLKAFEGVGGGLRRGGGLPHMTVALNSDTGGTTIPAIRALLSEAGSLQLEFRHLTRLTGRKEFAIAVETIVKDLYANPSPPYGLYPNRLAIREGEGVVSTGSVITFGGSGDSFYEYLLKSWLQGGRREGYLREMYDGAMDGLHELLVKRSGGDDGGREDGLLYLAEGREGERLDHKMDHLACFMAGTLALGAYTHPNGLDSDKAQRDLKTGKALAYTCYQMYARSKTGLSPEYIRFQKGKANYTIPPILNSAESESSTSLPSSYRLRPETVESLYILHKLTKDPTYRDWAWEIFEAIEANCKTPAGYGSVRNVEVRGAIPENRMESYFLAETLKYLHLLFDEGDGIDILDKHVFNTEAHPLKVVNILNDLELS